MTLYDGNEAFTKEVKNKNWHLKLYYNFASCRNTGKEQRIEGACGAFVKDLTTTYLECVKFGWKRVLPLK